jgi:hypothetical protein
MAAMVIEQGGVPQLAGFRDLDEDELNLVDGGNPFVAIAARLLPLVWETGVGFTPAGLVVTGVAIAIVAGVTVYELSK